MFKTLALMALLAAPLAAQTTTLKKTSTLSVSATDTTPAIGDTECGVASVQFYIGGQAIGPLLTAPTPDPTKADSFGFLWDTTTVPNGPYFLTARVLDKAGFNGACDSTKQNLTISDPINITVLNIPDDVTPPTVIINVPLSGALITNKQQTIQVAASDTSQISKMSIKIGGVTKATNANQNAIPYVWNTAPYKGQRVLIEATATDTAGNVSTVSETVTVKR